jgi:hypothetical protein
MKLAKVITSLPYAINAIAKQMVQMRIAADSCSMDTSVLKMAWFATTDQTNT